MDHHLMFLSSLWSTMCMLSVEMKNKVATNTATTAWRECSCGYGYSCANIATFPPTPIAFILDTLAMLFIFPIQNLLASKSTSRSRSVAKFALFKIVYVCTRRINK